MQLDIYQIDAFTNQPFHGNPAAVVPLQRWLPEATMQAIALENNLSETAFFVPEQDGFYIRWFTPKAEVKLCGHATLATAYVIFNKQALQGDAINFNSKSGSLQAVRRDNYIQLDFPAIFPDEVPIDVPAIAQACNQTVQAVYKSKQDYLAILESEQAVHNLQIDFDMLKKLDNRGVIYTAKGDNCDFVSRCFFPKYDVNEDPVTGSAHCVSVPYWARTLGKTKLNAKQVSARGGDLICELVGERVLLLGEAVPYMQGKIKI
jgi:PhzF family phenazine biosynthesis protein